MSKRISTNAIKIKKTEYEKLMAWSLSFQEIGALCFGRKGKILNVVRIPNELQSKNYFIWNRFEKLRTLKEMYLSGYKLMAEMHSHPCRNHLRRPSKMDHQYFNCEVPHLIAFPIEGHLSAWWLDRRHRNVKAAKIKIILLN